MTNQLQKISILLLNLFLGSFVLTMTNIQFVQAQSTFTPDKVCKWVNNQSGSVSATDEATKTDDATNNLNLKIVVITEEPLGAADNKDFSFRCFRATECKLETNTTPGKDADPKTKTPAVPAKTTTLRKCTTTYQAAACTASSPDDYSKNLKDPSGNFTTCEPVQIYIANAGTDLLYRFIGQIYRYVAGIGGVLAVLIIIVSAIRISASGGSEDVGKAKAVIIKCITGLVLLFFSAVILYTINPNFFVIS